MAPDYYFLGVNAVMGMETGYQRMGDGCYQKLVEDERYICCASGDRAQGSWMPFCGTSIIFFGKMP